MRIVKTHRSPVRLRSGAILGMGALALVLAGCDTGSLVDLNNPDLITGPVARDTANINELRNGVRFEFARALTGVAQTNESPGIVGISGVMADELWYASTFGTMQDIDRRNMQDVLNSALTDTYSRLHRARNLAERASGQYQVVGRENSVDGAMMRNLAGFTYVFFAENFCSGVPISSTALTGDVVYGAAQTTAQVLDSATARFNQALAAATAANSAQQQNVARVGLARVLLDQGKFAEAAAIAKNVPSDFVYQVEYTTTTSSQGNGLWQNVNGERRSSAASGEGGNGLVFFRRGAAPGNTIDPRVKVDSIGFGGSTTIPFYTQLKYPNRGAGVPLASGVEARLIEAEALLNKGASAAYLPILNSLRASAGVEGTLTDPGTADGRVKQFFQERAFNLWLTGHRLSDLRRMVRQYGYKQEQVFPTGQTIFGAPYGSDVNLPIPDREKNNPEDSTAQCLDRNA